VVRKSHLPLKPSRRRERPAITPSARPMTDGDLGDHYPPLGTRDTRTIPGAGIGVVCMRRALGPALLRCAAGSGTGSPRCAGSLRSSHGAHRRQRLQLAGTGRPHEPVAVIDAGHGRAAQVTVHVTGSPTQPAGVTRTGEVLRAKLVAATTPRVRHAAQQPFELALGSSSERGAGVSRTAPLTSSDQL
jgi:hypothetical protein